MQHVLTQEPLPTIINVTQPDSSSGNEAGVDVSEDEWLGRAKSNILLNNLCEVLNRQLLDGRDKPIITCLEYIREYLMKRIVNVQKVQDKCDGPLTPSTAKIFKLIVRAAAKLKVEWNGVDFVSSKLSPWGDQFVVNRVKRVCSCRQILDRYWNTISLIGLQFIAHGSQQSVLAGHGDAAHVHNKLDFLVNKSHRVHLTSYLSYVEL
ncbi:hypothetical protein Tco_1401247 [Tanacetum coccineum]